MPCKKSVLPIHQDFVVSRHWHFCQMSAAAAGVVAASKLLFSIDSMAMVWIRSNGDCDNLYLAYYLVNHTWMQAVDEACRHPAAQTIAAAAGAVAADQVCIVQRPVMWIHLVASLINFASNLIGSVRVAFGWRISNVLCHHHICSIACCFGHGPDVATNMNSAGRQYSICSYCHCNEPHDGVVFAPSNNADMHLSPGDALVWHLARALYATFFMCVCVYAIYTIAFHLKNPFELFFWLALFRMHFFIPLFAGFIVIIAIASAAIEQFTSLTILFISSIFVAFFRLFTFFVRSVVIVVDDRFYWGKFQFRLVANAWPVFAIENYQLQCLSWVHAMHDWRTVELNGSKGSIIWIEGRERERKSIQWQTSAMEFLFVRSFRMLLPQETKLKKLCSCRCFQF